MFFASAASAFSAIQRTLMESWSFVASCLGALVPFICENWNFHPCETCLPSKKLWRTCRNGITRSSEPLISIDWLGSCVISRSYNWCWLGTAGRTLRFPPRISMSSLLAHLLLFGGVSRMFGSRSVWCFPANTWTMQVSNDAGFLHSKA